LYHTLTDTHTVYTGTLCDTDHIHMQCWADLLKPYGYKVTKQFYNTEISGGANSNLAKKFFPNHSEMEQNQLMSDKEAKARELFGTSLVPLPGLIELIQYLQQHNIKIAAVTNAPKLNAYFMLNAINVTKLFDSIVLAEECTDSKPSPIPYITAMKQLNITHEQCIIFEDSLNGCRAGVGSNVLTIGVSTTHTVDALCGVGVQYVIHDFTCIKLDQSLLNMNNFIIDGHTC
jgi:HAD superfamily hydrolase (TIGR01509 family)